MCGCGITPTESSLERRRFFKPENNTGCCCPGIDSCSKPSKARVDSPLWEWEQIHGKLLNTVTRELGSDGRWHHFITRAPCEVTSTRSSRKGCCSLGYKVIR